MIIRDPAPRDEGAWRRLWAGYAGFYETGLPEAVTARTWQRILDPASPIFARLACEEGAREEERVTGFAVCVLHEGTWVTSPICYLEDLFVDPEYRGKGIGRRLIADLVERARDSGWSRLYWHTRAGNPARHLYDGFTEADDYVRYRLVFRS